MKRTKRKYLKRKNPSKEELIVTLVIEWRGGSKEPLRKIVGNFQTKEIPRIGESIECSGIKYGKVINVIWKLDMISSSGTKIVDGVTTNIPIDAKMDLADVEIIIQGPIKSGSNIRGDRQYRRYRLG